jgi:hypothetical protein
MSHRPSLFETKELNIMQVLTKLIFAGLEIAVAVILAVLKDDDG